MAEIQEAPQEGKKGKAKKQSTKVDLTAMVDLAFLLITFFMFTTTLSKPKVMPIVLPADSQEEGPELDDSFAMTILIAPKNQVIYYYGQPEKAAANPEAVKSTNYDKEKGLRKVLLSKKKRVDAMGEISRDKKGLSKFMVLIKPTDSSVYGNMVDVLDEMKIADIKRYALIPISDPEKKMVETALANSKKK